MIAPLVLLAFTAACLTHGYRPEFKTLSPGETYDLKSSLPIETVYSNSSARGVPPDNGGNYGDLVYRHRENEDTLLFREVIIDEVLSSEERDTRWYVSIPGARISSVRVLNFGRNRAYCLRIDVAGGDVQVFLRIRALSDPRVMIEVYGS